MDGDYSHFRTATELRTGVLLWQVVSPILILFGTFGNVLSILVISRSGFNKWTSTVYFLLLALADLSTLYVGLLRQWVKYTFGVDIRHVSVFTCKVHWWLMYVTADCSVWILTAITVERLLSAVFPYRSKQFCTTKRAKAVIVVIVTTALLINSHLLYGFGRLEIKSDNATIVIPCAPNTDAYDIFFEHIWTWIDLCKFSLVPFGVLTTGNIGIILRVLISKRKVRSQITASIAQRNDKTSNMSILLVSLNCMFILCTLPVCIYFIGAPYWIPKDVPRKIQLQDPWWAVVNLLMYLNNSVNFFLYCLSGSRFRETVKNLFSHKLTTVTQPSVTANFNSGAVAGSTASLYM